MSLIKPTPVFGEKQPPPPEFKEQFLFLLEFYIFEIRGDRLAKLNQMFFVPTCVSFHFLDFQGDDLEITPVDLMFEPQAGIADDIEYFYSGRSVMFSVAEHVVAQKLSELKIKLFVKKKMPESIKPDVLIGEGEIDMTKQFTALRKEMFQCWHVGVPPPQIFEDEVPLIFKKEEVGAIKVFVRLSAFGQCITTEFEAPKGEKSFVFKGNKINDKGLSYKCRIIDSKEVDISCKSSTDDSAKKDYQHYPCAPCGLNFAKPLAKKESRSENCLRVPDSKIAKSKTDLRKETRGPIQSSRGPTQPCGKAVVLKVSGLLDVGDEKKQPTVTVAPESGTGIENSDPDHDVFILRIGKKGLVGPNEKSDLQLEMKTPRGPERRPPIRHETREAQTDEETGEKKTKGGKKKKKKKK